jgi:hypothetical protein
MTTNTQELIKPATVERDADGYWSHPGMPDGDDDSESANAFKAWMAEQRLTHQISNLESEDETHPAYHAYYEEECCGVVGWNPEPLTGNGWFTLSIHDTEDGPMWVWVRRIDERENGRAA